MDNEEEIVYYFFNIINYCKDNNAKKIIDNFKTGEKIDSLEKKINGNYEDLFLFLKFIRNIKKSNKNSAYMIIEQFYSEDKINIYYLFLLIIGLNSGLDVDEFLNIKDELIKKIFLAYKLYFQKKFNSSYKVIASISYIQKYKPVIDLLLLQNLIELDLIDEALNILKEFLSKNKMNILFNLLVSTIYFKKDNNLQAIKTYTKFKNRLQNKKLRENYLYLLLKLNKEKHWINVITKYSNLEDQDYFYIAKYYHKMGFLDIAYDYYKKIDPIKFPVNKMIGIIYYQMGKIDETIKFLKKEIEVRGEHPDINKMLKYLQLKSLLKK